MINLSITKDHINVATQGKVTITLEHDNTNPSHVERLARLKEIEDEAYDAESMDHIDALWEEVVTMGELNFKDRVEGFHPNISYNPASKNYYIKVGDVVSNESLPPRLVEMLQLSVEKGLSIDPLVKNWVRFLRNPKMRGSKAEDFKRRYVDYLSSKYFNRKVYDELLASGLSEELARDKALVDEIAITRNGFITCYKVSAEVDHKFEKNADGEIVRVDRYATSFDENTGEIIEFDKSTLDPEDRLFQPYMQGTSGDAFTCKAIGSKGKGFGDKLGHFIKIGCVISLPEWSMVDTDDSVNCRPGLHVGNLSYLAGWSTEEQGSGVLHTVLVDPMHIGAIPIYSDANAIRVKEYYVNGSFSVPTKAIYHESVYDNHTLTEWNAVLAELKEHIVESLKEAVSVTDEAFNQLSI